MKSLRVLALVLALALMGCATVPLVPQASPSPSALPGPSSSLSPGPAPPRSLPNFSTDAALAHVRVLSVDIGRRPSGSLQDARAVDYISAVLRDAGYHVRTQAVIRVGGARTRNVIARHPDADYSAGYLLVGAHHDTVPESPGANDNASGVAVMLGVAEGVFELSLPVEFIAFGAEEFQADTRRMLEGSLAYMTSVPDLRVIDAMLSIDMVGTGSSVLIMRQRGTDAAVQAELRAIAQAEDIPQDLMEGGSISDHATFASAGIPSAHLWTGEHPTLHSPTDTLEVVQAGSLDRMGRVTTAWLRSRFI